MKGMEQYISKSALLAEIEKRRKEWRYGSSTEAKFKREECDDILSFINTLEMKEVPISEDLEEAVNAYIGYAPEVDECSSVYGKRQAFKAGAKWKEHHLWKPADGDDLPEIDREIIVLCKNCRVAFGHRPVEKFMARPIGYGKFEECEVKTYDKGGWNIPDVKYWLDCQIPNIED